jgi:DNA-binding response OmpR family regulator
MLLSVINVCADSQVGAMTDNLAEAHAAQRVLVVDDAEEVRILIRRVLRADGYEVDVASTLAEARAAEPCRYDAVLVDARLGSERGLDLVEELRSQDPAAAARCLLITGGASEQASHGVARLTKPFEADKLLAAVHALHSPSAATSGHTGMPGPGRARDEDQSAAALPPVWRLLSAARELRMAERGHVLDFLHDKPMQELTAAALELQLLRRTLPPGQDQAGAAVMRNVDAAAAALRSLVDQDWSVAQPSSGLAAILQQRAGWLLDAPLTVAAEEPTGLSAADIPVVADVVELMLLALLHAGPSARAHVAARAGDAEVHVELTLTPAAGEQALAEPAPARAALAQLAAALQATAHCKFCPERWRVKLELSGTSVVSGS